MAFLVGSYLLYGQHRLMKGNCKAIGMAGSLDEHKNKVVGWCKRCVILEGAKADLPFQFIFPPKELRFFSLCIT